MKLVVGFLVGLLLTPFDSVQSRSLKSGVENKDTRIKYKQNAIGNHHATDSASAANKYLLPKAPIASRIRIERREERTGIPNTYDSNDGFDRSYESESNGATSDTPKSPSARRVNGVSMSVNGKKKDDTHNTATNGSPRLFEVYKRLTRKRRRRTIQTNQGYFNYKLKYSEKASIHVVPKLNSMHHSRAFDRHGNINGSWEAVSRTNMKLIINQPRNASDFNEAVIVVRSTGNYFIYGQILFHGKNHEMGHCLYASDSYKPCWKATCEDRKVMCSRSAPGHPTSIKGLPENINTNYIGGIVYLKQGSAIRLGVVANQHVMIKEPIQFDKTMCYFGAFSV
ncbi:unnamed protein product [Owenia fusiformis]|uniref:THD domain-containing protein n=1 Tax=Owenia fusiformis TaxID=6347 RepID=A0A8J1TGK8_OWEFU|nr:unnamed protein product [Owenia fusiformis]